jgi:hypothetical protein
LEEVRGARSTVARIIGVTNHETRLLHDQRISKSAQPVGEISCKFRAVTNSSGHLATRRDAVGHSCHLISIKELQFDLRCSGVSRRAGDSIRNQVISADLQAQLVCLSAARGWFRLGCFSASAPTRFRFAQFLRLGLGVRRRLARDFSDVMLCDETLGTLSVASSRFVIAFAVRPRFSSFHVLSRPVVGVPARLGYCALRAIGADPFHGVRRV